VGGGETATGLGGERQRFANQESASAHAVAEGHAVEELGDDVGLTVVRADVEDGDHVRVGDRGGGARLALETLQAVGIGRDAIGQDLEGHVAAEAGVAAAVHLAHATGDTTSYGPRRSPGESMPKRLEDDRGF
jgi:hypothetical protein